MRMRRRAVAASRLCPCWRPRRREAVRPVPRRFGPVQPAADRRRSAVRCPKRMKERLLLAPMGAQAPTLLLAVAVVRLPVPAMHRSVRRLSAHVYRPSGQATTNRALALVVHQFPRSPQAIGLPVSVAVHHSRQCIDPCQPCPMLHSRSGSLRRTPCLPADADTLASASYGSSCPSAAACVHPGGGPPRLRP